MCDVTCTLPKWFRWREWYNGGFHCRLMYSSLTLSMRVTFLLSTSPHHTHTQISQLQQIKNVANQVSSKLPPTTNRSTSVMYRPRCASFFRFALFSGLHVQIWLIAEVYDTGVRRERSELHSEYFIVRKRTVRDRRGLLKKEREKKNLVKPNRMLTRPG